MKGVTVIGSTESALSVVNAIDSIAFDLNSSSFSETTNISNDYIFDSVLLNFSTNEVKTITITGPDGTILWGGTVDTTAANLGFNTTKQNFNLIFNQAFNANDNITVSVTQFGSAGTMDCILKIIEGSSTLTGSPVLGAGNEIIGRVIIQPVTDNNPQTFEDTSFVVGDSPVSLNLNTVLSRNATQFTVINDGAGSFKVAISNDGISFGGEHTMNNGETYNLELVSVHTIRITHVTDSAYRVIYI